MIMFFEYSIASCYKDFSRCFGYGDIHMVIYLSLLLKKGDVRGDKDHIKGLNRKNVGEALQGSKKWKI